MKTHNFLLMRNVQIDSLYLILEMKIANFLRIKCMCVVYFLFLCRLFAIRPGLFEYFE